MKLKNINWLKVRIFSISCLLILCFALIVLRMFQLQVVKKEQLYRLAAQQQYVNIPLLPKRGMICDGKGDEMGVSIEVDSVYADPRSLTDLEKTSRDLGSIPQIGPKELKPR